jgi:hypothetical protein
MLPTNTLIFTVSLNNMYLLLNHVRNSSSQYNPNNKTLKTCHHNITIFKVRAHTNTIGNDEAEKLAK